MNNLSKSTLGLKLLSHSNNLDHNFGHISSSSSELSFLPFTIGEFKSPSGFFIPALCSSYVLHLFYYGCVYALCGVYVCHCMCVCVRVPLHACGRQDNLWEFSPSTM